MISETVNKTKQKSGHIVVLTGSTFQGSGPNLFILNSALSWKKLGYRITIICQDRNAEHMSEVDSYIKDKFPKDAPKLKDGQLRVIFPNINGIIPIYATYQYCEFPGIKSKPVHEMSEQQIQTNIEMTIKCLKSVCQHDRPFKVIANYMIMSGTIAHRGLKDLKIPYDIITPGPALAYSVKPYPHLWKWVLPGFEKASTLFQLTHFVNDQFQKCFKDQIEKNLLKQKVAVINPGFYPNKCIIPDCREKCEQLFLQKIKSAIINSEYQGDKQVIQFSSKDSPQKIHEILLNNSKSNRKISIQNNLYQKWVSYSAQDQAIIYVGAMINNKGMGQLLAIAPKLISQRPSLKFIFCGDGPYKQHMHQLLKAYEDGDFERAKRIGLAGQFITQINIQDFFIKIDDNIKDRIIFCGLTSQDILSNLLPLCTIYINPNKILQASSTNLIQAMCFGLTPICNDHSWPRQVLDIIQQQYPQLTNVIRVEKSKFFKKLPQTIVKTLDFIKNNKLEKMEYQQKIRKISIDNYSWDNIALKLAETRQWIQQQD